MRICGLILLLSCGICVSGQPRKLDRAGIVTFFSKAPIENIEARSNNAMAILDTESNKIAASILIRSFEFEKSLMQEHFNENYLESHKFPKATFTGKVLDKIDYTTAGKKRANVAGEITLHGVTKPLKALVDLEITEDQIKVKTKFYIKVADFDIRIPNVVVNNIAEEVEVTAEFVLK